MPHSPAEWATLACLHEAFRRRQVALIFPAKASIPRIAQKIGFLNPSPPSFIAALTPLHPPLTSGGIEGGYKRGFS
jgi:hypothetical protein